MLILDLDSASFWWQYIKKFHVRAEEGTSRILASERKKEGAAEKKS